MPDKGSALRSVYEQGRGDSQDERNLSNIRKHNHDGVNSPSVNLRDLAGFIKTVTAAPTWIPKNFFEQFVIYKNGATKRFYWYDTVNKEWDFVVGT